MLRNQIENFSFFVMCFLFVRFPTIGFFSAIRMLPVNFRPLSLEGISNDRLANPQPGAKTWTEIDYHRDVNAEFPRQRAATETFFNIFVHD
jgi:hypothetical protein